MSEFLGSRREVRLRAGQALASAAVAAETGSARRRGRAFGVDLEADFAIDGLAAICAAGVPAPTRLVSSASADLEAGRWRRGAGRLVERRFPDGRLALTVDHSDRKGYLLWYARAGRYLVSPDGRRVQCRLPAVGVGRWQRYLAAQVLPLVAALRGLAVIHASAVCLEGRTVAFVASSGAGKTSLAARLVLAGASFVTDDVLALEPADGRVVAHPGPAFATIDAEDRELLRKRGRTHVGTVIRRSDKVHVAMESAAKAAPLDSIYFLARTARGRRAKIEPLSPPDPRLLLASAFLPHLVATARLPSQLLAAAALSHSVTAYRVLVPDAVGAGDLAETVGEHATATGGVS